MKILKWLFPKHARMYSLSKELRGAEINSDYKRAYQIQGEINDILGIY